MPSALGVLAWGGVCVPAHSPLILLSTSGGGQFRAAAAGYFEMLPLLRGPGEINQEDPALSGAPRGPSLLS